jgi:nitrate/TMAO reductase-like tetraheme cytochrome c subunit
MDLSTMASIAFTLVTALVIVIVITRPSLVSGPGGKTIALVSIAVLPTVATTFGMNAHLELSKTTDFCLSCHVMEPYGKSLHVDDKDHVPAAHFLNSRVPRDHACFSCHTTYTLYGDANAKMKGLRHIWVNYFGTVPAKIKLYEPFQNRECLHCHGGARTFEEQEFHQEYREQLQTNETSCLECHDKIHDIEHLGELKKWEPPHGE